MDTILADHSPANLEQTFDADFLYSHPLYSLMAERTVMPWLLIIPKQALEASQNLEYIQQLYGEIYRLIGFMQQNRLGGRFNLAKIGNKNINQHIHLVFRNENDECWPDAIWCHEPLAPSDATSQHLKQQLAAFYQNG